MNHLKTSDLTVIARRTMFENNFVIDFPPEVTQEIETLENNCQPFAANSSVRDLRLLRWSSIDNKSSLDLDQIEYAEQLPNGDIKILVGIADVDALVPQNSAIDKFAAQNTVTIYTESVIFPMLPAQLSTDLTSLREDVDRLAIVVEMIVSATGETGASNVYRALVKNYAKLSYEETGAWLDENTAPPAIFLKVEGLREQILLQQKAALGLAKFRREKGALEFETVESEAVTSGGEITNLKTVLPNAAQNIIENLMIAANVEMAEFLESKNIASLRRVVKTPARWEGICRIAAAFGENLPEMPDSLALSNFLEKRKAADAIHFPDLSLSIIKLLGAGEYVVQLPNEDAGGHFGLAVRDYAHSTAPNRRYSDLIVQRLVKAALENKPSLYSIEELQAIAAHCNERESAARKVERQMRKVVAASVMQNRVGEIFDAIVTGITPSGTFARILRPPVDGRIIKGEENLKIGEQISVRLIGTNVERGFIDFVCER
ncbi:MAG: RNB domain-containing ribonuclease [Pyrinomonadaceae bacterium]